MYGIGRCWNGLAYGMLLLCEKVSGIPTVCDGTFQSELLAEFEAVGLGTTSITTDLWFVGATLRGNDFGIFVDLTALEVKRLASS